MILAQAAEGGSLRIPVEYSTIFPALALIGGALILLGWSSLTHRRRAAIYPVISIAAAAAAFGGAWNLWSDVTDHGPMRAIGDAVVIDGFAVFFMVVICVAVILGALVGDAYVRREGLEGPEFHVLMLLSASGGMLMASANDLIVLFLGLEILSIALYVLAGFNGRRQESHEAAMKYFVLGAFSSALLLYGIALIYGATGSTNLANIAAYLAANVVVGNGIFLAGMALLLVGLGFKVAAVPFHTWTPDVYQGAPSPVTGFMAAAAKAAGFAGLLRVFFSTFSTLQLDWQPIIAVIAVATLLVGSVLAVVQTDIKRMLAYSSISHAGYVLVGLQAASNRGIAGSLYYLLAYTFMVLGSFAIVTVVGRKGDARHDIDAYRGLASNRPALALAFTDPADGPGRHPVHHRIPGQVLRDRCRGRQRLVHPGHDRHAGRCDRRVLLPARDHRHVRPAGRGRGSAGPAARAAHRRRRVGCYRGLHCGRRPATRAGYRFRSPRDSHLLGRRHAPADSHWCGWRTAHR